jgi:hypothetical protein
VGPGLPPSLDRMADERPERYLARPVRPVVQIAARVALWGAVAFGCVGGLVAMVRPSDGGAEPVATTSDDAIVPAAVAGTAERIVAEWLTATEADSERMEDLFVEVPSIGNPGAQVLEVRDVTTVSGRRLADGYWAVTVAADVVDAEPEEGDPGATEAAMEEAAGGVPEEELSREGTWYLDVGIVGQVDGGLVGLAAPAVMPGPPAAEPEWNVGDVTFGDASEGDPVATTVQGFLSAMLTGDGDPSRYAAPGAQMRAANPAPFADVTVQEIATDEMEDGRLWVLAQVVGTTRGGVSQIFVYDLIVAQRVDRWEVDTLSGVPTVLREAPPAETTTTQPAADEGDGS